MTWTPATVQSETWTSESQTELRVFSPLVFSHASHTGKFVFAFKNSDVEGWHNRTVEAESWTAA